MAAKSVAAIPAESIQSIVAVCQGLSSGPPQPPKHSTATRATSACGKGELCATAPYPVINIFPFSPSAAPGQHRIYGAVTGLNTVNRPAVGHLRVGQPQVQVIEEFRRLEAEIVSVKAYTLKRKISEKVNPPKIRYLSKAEEGRLLQALQERDQELRERRARYVAWQSKRNHKKQHEEPFAEEEFPDHVTPIIILAYQTGFDLGDIFDLHWEHIDFPNNQISKIRNKTSHKADNPQPVVVPMSPKVKNTLEQWGKQHGMRGRIFKSPITSGRLDNISKAWRSVLASAELKDFRFKDLRHTFGSWLAIENVGILQIRDLMGHTDVKTTQVYAHLCPDRKEQSVLNVFS